MKKVVSNDGTSIAFDQSGKGAPVILVDGATTSRAFGPMTPLAALLAPNFAVVNYDRRGRGDSGDTPPYDVKREVEDIEALVKEVGGSTFLFGTSSGAALAFEAALALGSKVKKLAMWEPPYNSDPAARQAFKQYRKNLADALASNRRGDAVVLFMNLVAVPQDAIQGMRQAPMWPMLEAVAPTLAYDAAVLGEDASVPVNRAAGISAPTLVMNGTVIPFMLDTATALAKTIPHAQHRTLQGQSHDVDLQVLSPVLVEFYTA